MLLVIRDNGDLAFVSEELPVVTAGDGDQMLCTRSPACIAEPATSTALDRCDVASQVWR